MLRKEDFRVDYSELHSDLKTVVDNLAKKRVRRNLFALGVGSLAATNHPLYGAGISAAYLAAYGYP